MQYKWVRILSIGLAILLIAVMACFFLYDTYTEKKQTQLWNDTESRILPYRSEIIQLKQQLQALNRPVEYYGESSRIISAFEVTELSDISYVREKAKKYELTPVIVLNPNLSLNLVSELVSLSDSGWEFMISMPSLDSATVTKATNIKKHLGGLKKSDCGIAFCRVQSIKDSELSVLKNAGFEGYTIFNEGFDSGQNEDGTVHFNYYRISSNDASLNASLAACYENSASMAVVLDVESVRTGKLTEEKATELLDKAKEYSNMENCSYSTVADTIEKLSEINSKKAEIEAARVEERADIERRIDELNELIADMQILP